MFLERLDAISDRIDGTLAVSIVAKDGITVESVSRSSELDLEPVVVELVSQARDIDQDHEELNVGALQILSLDTEKYCIMLSSVAKDYYLILILKAEAARGRARFEMRRARLQFEADLI